MADLSPFFADDDRKLNLWLNGRRSRKWFARYRSRLRHDLVLAAGLATRWSGHPLLTEACRVVREVNPNRIRIPRSLRRYVDEANRV